jgi:hypothetical protein
MLCRVQKRGRVTAFMGRNMHIYTTFGILGPFTNSRHRLLHRLSVTIKLLLLQKDCGSSTSLNVPRFTCRRKHRHILDQRYSNFFVRVPPDLISLQLCTPKVVGA